MKALLLTFLFPFIAMSQGTKEYPLDAFNKIRLNGSIQVHIVISDEHKVIISSDQEIDFDELEVSQKGSEVKIGVKKGEYKGRAPKVEVYVKNISSIKALGNAGVNYELEDDIIVTEEIELEAQIGGHIHIKLKSTFVEANVSQGGRITLSGETTNLDAKVNTGGTIAAYNLKTEKVLARVKAGGDIFVSPGKELDAKVTAGGTIKYKGDPAELKVNTLGGTIEKVKDK